MKKMLCPIIFNRENKRQKIPKGQSKIDNQEKLATQDTQDEEQ